MSNLAELAEFLETPEGRAQTEREEKQYRKGYWDGVYQTLIYLAQGVDKRQLDNWCNDALWNWRYGNTGEFVMPPENIPWRELRKQVFARDGDTCAYCGARGANNIDHIIPVARGGSYDMDNLVVACKACNSKKGAHLPYEIGMYPNGDERWR